MGTEAEKVSKDTLVLQSYWSLAKDTILKQKIVAFSNKESRLGASRPYDMPDYRPFSYHIGIIIIYGAQKHESHKENIFLNYLTVYGGPLDWWL